MKSFTPNQANNPALRADKRFDALIKKEMQEHEHLISEHNKEMQALRDLISISMQRFDSLYERVETDLKDAALALNQQILFLREKVLSQEVMLKTQKESIDSLHYQLAEFHQIYASSLALEKQKKEFDQGLKSNTERNINSFQECQREFKALFNSLNADLIGWKIEIEKKFSDVNEKVDNNISVLRIDRDGVLKEIRVYEKTIFIIEKKIENLYTLIERVNQSKGGALCHKQD